MCGSRMVNESATAFRYNVVKYVLCDIGGIWKSRLINRLCGLNLFMVIPVRPSLMFLVPSFPIFCMVDFWLFVWILRIGG